MSATSTLLLQQQRAQPSLGLSLLCAVLARRLARRHWARLRLNRASDDAGMLPSAAQEILELQLTLLFVSRGDQKRRVA
jgi:hypothetical protein